VRTLEDVKRAATLLVGVGLIALAGQLAEAVAAPSRTCASLAGTEADLSEGPPSAADAAINLKSRGTLRAAVIFVDFSDAPGSEAPSALVERWLEPGQQWLRTTSYGRFAIELQPMTGWVRMPRTAASYGFTAVDLTYETHRTYITDAIAAADPTFDFSQTDIVYVVAAETDQIPESPTFRGVPGTFVVDGRELGPAVTFGRDAYTYGRTILPHETGHMLGLPDLYAFNGAQHRFVGTWDLMGNVFKATDLFAWHRLKLRWLDAAQVVCAPRDRSTTVALRPLGAKGGRKAVFVRTGSTTGMLVENRQRVGNDRSICDRGALVYTVDSSIDSGYGPVKVVRGSAAGCGFGPRSDAPLHAGESVSVRGVRVAVAESRRRNITVRVTVR
jgi:M6 family metalloprotease-like protein